MRILLIEDEKKVSNFIRKALQEEGHAVDQAFDGEKGLDLAETYEYDLVVLDLMLPPRGGETVLDTLKKKEAGAAVLILTAKDSLREKVTLLDRGADDYLTKPFSVEEFLARVRALLRRPPQKGNAVLKMGNLSLNPATREVRRGNRKIELTNKEFSLLQYFMRNSGKVLTRTMIAEHVWDIDFDSESNVIDVYVTYLRNKIDRGEPSPFIRTVRGVGYRMLVE